MGLAKKLQSQCISVLSIGLAIQINHRTLNLLQLMFLLETSKSFNKPDELSASIEALEQLAPPMGESGDRAFDTCYHMTRGPSWSRCYPARRCLSRCGL